MSGYRYIFLSFCCLAATFSKAQVTDIEEKKPAVMNGVEYGYIIKNEQTKAVSNEEYARFEITLYATNKSGCTKLYAENISEPGRQNLVATFNCTNANGKRLTAKGGELSAKEFLVTVKSN